jgi:hypothetical protein
MRNVWFARLRTMRFAARLWLLAWMLFAASIAGHAQMLVVNDVSVLDVKSGAVLPDRAATISGTRITRSHW